MPQTNVIVTGLIIGFLVFITAKGQLKAYLQVLGLVSGDISGGVSALNNVPLTSQGNVITPMSDGGQVNPIIGPTLNQQIDTLPTLPPIGITPSDLGTLS